MVRIAYYTVSHRRAIALGELEKIMNKSDLRAMTELQNKGMKYDKLVTAMKAALELSHDPEVEKILLDALSNAGEQPTNSLSAD